MTDTPHLPRLAPGEIKTGVTLVNTTMGDLGDCLPHGVRVGERTPFQFNPPTHGTQKKLGAVKARPDLQKTPGKLITYWLAEALSSLGSEPMAKRREEGALKVAALTQGDLLYLLFRWKAHSHPEGLPLRGMSCGACGMDFDVVRLDLNELPVEAMPEDVSPDNPPGALVGLHHGFPFKGETVRTVQVRPPAWVNTYFPLTKAVWSNEDLVAGKIWRASICATDQGPVQRLPDEAIDGIWPADAALLNDAIGRITPTVDLRIEVDCPTCGNTNRGALDPFDLASL